MAVGATGPVVAVVTVVTGKKNSNSYPLVNCQLQDIEQHRTLSNTSLLYPLHFRRRSIGGGLSSVKPDRKCSVFCLAQRVLNRSRRAIQRHNRESLVRVGVVSV